VVLLGTLVVVGYLTFIITIYKFVLKPQRGKSEGSHSPCRDGADSCTAIETGAFSSKEWAGWLCTRFSLLPGVSMTHSIRV
jgi:hypothetical protein